MGLDWVLYGRPRPGAEAEFARLTRTIHRSRSCARRARRARREPAARHRRRDELALSPFAEVGCPCIGVDEAADRWLRARYASGTSIPSTSGPRCPGTRCSDGSPAPTSPS